MMMAFMVVVALHAYFCMVGTAFAACVSSWCSAGVASAAGVACA
jgi:hypothetical protein